MKEIREIQTKREGVRKMMEICKDLSEERKKAGKFSSKVKEMMESRKISRRQKEKRKTCKDLSEERRKAGKLRQGNDGNLQRFERREKKGWKF